LVSNDERPELQALDELERAVADLTGELSSWRRRALRAEGEQAELGSGYDAVGNRERIMELEAENKDLLSRLAAARTRVNELLGRLRFLEEQVAIGEQAR
jgi:chromosome segregation ATPase